jgi:uncharacterized protein YndB with AHSA1/START domain
MRYVLIVMLWATAVYGQEVLSFVNEGTIDASVEEVWEIWSTSEGYKKLGPALADVDMRVGGLIRSRYSPDGVLGDAQTIENLVMAYEPQRMLAIRIHKTPENFPFREAWKNTWTVVTLTAVGNGQTHMRVASMGYGTDEEALAMKRFFEQGNQQTITLLQNYFADKK